jgi:hypothetical protein
MSATTKPAWLLRTANAQSGVPGARACVESARTRVFVSQASVERAGFYAPAACLLGTVAELWGSSNTSTDVLALAGAPMIATWPCDTDATERSFAL